MSDKRFFFRFRGKVMGPFDLQQLKKLRDRGQFRGFYEVSEDRKAWVSASSMTEVFPVDQLVPDQDHRPTPQDAPIKPDGPQVPPSQPLAEWYYINANEKRQGPLTQEDLLSLLRTGAISTSTPVWRPSMTDWVELSAAITSLPSEAPSTRKLPGSKRIRAVVLTSSLVAVVLGLAVGFFLYFKTPIYSPEQIGEMYGPWVYAIKSESGAGSGILIANDSKLGLIVTSRQAVDPKRQLTPEGKRGLGEELPKVKISARNSVQSDPTDVDLAAVHRGWDAALLVIEIKAESSDSLLVAKQKSLKLDQGVVALGYPRDFDLVTPSGRISSTSNEAGFIQTTCALNGIHGGPLFLTRRGLLAGINTMSTGAGSDNTAENLNSAIAVEQLISSLKDRQSDRWVWSPELKKITRELLDLISFED